MTRMCRSVMTAIWLGVAAAPALRAQASPLAPICPAGQQPRVDSAVVTVALAAVRPYRDTTYTIAARQQVLYYGDAIRQHFVPPGTLGDLPPLAVVESFPTERAEDGLSTPLSGRLILIIKPNGRTRVVAWESSPLAASLSSAIVMAVRAAEAAGDFDGIMPATETTSSDTLAVDIVAVPNGAGAQLPLMRAQLTTYRAETPPMVTKPGVMEYPMAARQSGVSTEGAVRFVVRADGRAEPSSIQVTKAGWVDFVRPMRRAVETTEYRAATSGGCAVPTLVYQTFDYRLRF